MEGPKLDLGSFTALSGLIEEASGIHLPEAKLDLLRSRLLPRLRALGLQGFGDYLEHLRGPAGLAELPDLLERVTTHKTEFYREGEHFGHLAGQAIPVWLASGAPGPFRVWCAAASTGEEPYTLAAVCLEALAGKAVLELVATDLSRKALAKAEAGSYPGEHLDALPGGLKARWFRPQRGGSWQPGPELRAVTRFGRLNLAAARYPFERGFHAIFCRNVMIYFKPQTQREVVARLEACLAPGAWLYTGLSESLLGFRHGLSAVAPSVYRKQGTLCRP